MKLPWYSKGTFVDRLFDGLTVLLALLFMAAAYFAVDLLLAQFVVWGLAQFHVNSGIWGPYFLLIALVSAIGLGSTAMRSKK